ncbi:MAG: M20/M25/M40 family metallo-hydrolase, partial [Gemmatimonadaceae bacterium]
MRRTLLAALVGLSTVVGSSGDHHRATGTATAPRVAIVVIDGLRPDLITPAHTPALAALRARGVTYTNTHSSFPTVTRVNAAVLTTGMFPAHTGIVGNTLYDAAVDSAGPISTGDDRALRRVAAHYGRLLPVPTLGERLQRAGLRYAVVTSSSSGGTFILNPEAPRGVGVTINPLLDGATRMSYTDSIGRAVTARFGAAPTDEEMMKTAGHHGPLVAWVDRVLREYVLPTLQPDVLAYWLTEPDHAQHMFGPGSPQGLAALAASDSAVGRLVAALDAAGGTTNIIVVSDHGFISHSDAVPVSGALVAAGLKHDRTSTDVVVVGDEHIAHIFVKHHDAAATRSVARFFEAQPYTAAVLARDSTIPGTFSLASVHDDNPTRGADLVEVLRWRPDTNAFGVPGQQMSVSGGAGTDVRPITTGASGHGGLSPYAVRSTMILAGPAFQRGVTIGTPSGNVDVMPTVLSLLGVPAPGLDGRVLREAFVGGRPESVKSTTTVFKARNGAFASSLQITSVGAETYVDAAWREPMPPASQGGIDSTAALLVDLIRANSSNPPGNTRGVAAVLAPRFRARGFDVKIIPTPDTGKVHFIARLVGDGSKRPVLIASHADVVGVERDKWTVDPFAGVIKDGHVMGRGAIDFKGGMAVFARAAMELAERKVPLARDVIFVAEADEEG